MLLTSEVLPTKFHNAIHNKHYVHRSTENSNE